MQFIVGANGRLGKTIARLCSDKQIITIDRSIYGNWGHNHASNDISRFFEKIQKNTKQEDNPEESIIYIPAGIHAPQMPLEDHHRINFLMPKHIIECASKLGLRTVTFGTVMEEIVGFSTNNPYFLSKTQLSNFINEFSITNNLSLHIRLHTLYGVGLPSPFMFLGQILNSIRNQTQFNMSSGSQLREYHHIEDDVQAIFTLVKTKMHGVIAIHHGAAISLKDIAQYLFNEFNCLDLLALGALPDPIKDNFNSYFERPAVLTQTMFRETLPAITTYLRSHIEVLGEME